MRKLTPSQFLTVQSLVDNPLISSVDIELTSNGLSRIMIKSAVGADYNEVDTALDDAISKEFANYEYMGTPAQYVNPVDGLEHELYFINFEGETLFYLIMRSESEQKEGSPTAIGLPVEKKDTSSHYTTSVLQVELPGPCECN